jgi:L-fuconolactonase
MRIDSHQHFWKLSRGDYHWMTPELPILYRDFMPDDLLPILGQFKFDKTIVVQAAQTVAETEFLLDLANKYDFIAGVVGWLDLESPSFAQDFEHYRQHAKFVGLRPMLQDLPDDAWICSPQVVRNLELVAEAQFPFEFLTHTRHLPYVLQVLKTFPNLHAVIDHMSKPEIRVKKMEPWKSLMSEAARHPNIYCKLSGMITEADHNNWKVDDLRPFVQHVVDGFGWDRLLFGSDWPVCLLAGDYGRVYDAVREVLAPSLTADREARFFGGNAERFYRLRPVISQ